MEKLSNREIEVRFLNVNANELKQKLKILGAKDLGEDFLEEIIFYDKELEWEKEKRKFVRLRKQKGNVSLTYKYRHEESATGTEEIEFQVSDLKKAKALLENIGLVASREQEKKRHSFELNKTRFDFDILPTVPCYLEIEASSEQELKEGAALLGLDWSQAIMEDPRKMVEKRYNIPIGRLKYFTFQRIE